MLSNAFKGAYQNEVAQQNKGISTITSGAKDLVTGVASALGFTGALGSGIVSTASKYALAGKVGGVGGAIMLASMTDRTNAVKNSMVNDFMVSEDGNTKAERAFDKVAGELKTDQEFETLDTVWNKLNQQAQKRKEAEMTKKLEETYKSMED